MIIDVSSYIDRQYAAIKAYVQSIPSYQPTPTLIVFSDQSNDANRAYTRQKEKKCVELGINYYCIDLTDMDGVRIGNEIRSAVSKHPEAGIMMQLPAPSCLTEVNIFHMQNCIPWYQDVDGLNKWNRIALTDYGYNAEKECFMLPCTAKGIFELLTDRQIPIAGKHAVIIGRSKIVGRPIADMLLHADATVTICHSKTENLHDITRQADILIVAAGKPGLIGADDVKQGATVIDVGINRDQNGKLCGDCRTKVIAAKADITPVPGGVGKLTVCALMQNVIQAHDYFVTSVDFVPQI